MAKPYCCNRNILDKNILYRYTSLLKIKSQSTKSVFAIGIPWDDDVSDLSVYSILWFSIHRKRRNSCSKILLFIHSMPTKRFYACSFLSSLNMANMYPCRILCMATQYLNATKHVHLPFTVTSVCVPIIVHCLLFE